MKKLFSCFSRTYFAAVFFTVLLTLSWTARAQQQYPVQISGSVKFASPFPEDYKDPGNMDVRILLTDVSKKKYRIKLYYKLEGQEQTQESPLTLPLELELDGGVPHLLNRPELEQLFNNLSTLSGEGIFTLSFTAYDAQLSDQVQVSNPNLSKFVFFVNLFDPPFLTQPATGTVFDQNQLNGNVFFNWQARHLSFSPTQKIYYKFKLVKVVPFDRNPYDAVNAATTGNNTLMIDQSDLEFPAFYYSPSDLPLEQGRVYAWRVEAYEKIGGTESSKRFKNMGQSEVFTFSVKENCSDIYGLTANSSQPGKVTLEWSSYDNTAYKGYEVAFRPSGTTADWMRLNVENTTQPNIVLTAAQLTPGTVYEYTVRPRCLNWGKTVYGGEFLLPAEQCPAPVDISVASSGGNMTFTWPDAGADSYTFNYKITGTTPDVFTQVSVTGLSHSILAIASGSYTVRVDAVCGVGDELITSLGDELNVPYNAQEGLVSPCRLPRPLTVTPVSVSPGNVTLTWTSDPAIHSGYDLSYWHSDSGDVRRGVTGLTLPTAQATGLVSGGNYLYELTFRCTGGGSIKSPTGVFSEKSSGEAPVVTDPLTADCFPPSVIKAEAVSATSARFEWSAVKGAENYRLYYSKKGQNTFVPFNTTGKSALIKDLEQDAVYQYVVQCRCGGMYSLFTDTAEVNLAAGKFTGTCDTSDIRLSRALTTELEVEWNYKTGHTGYQIVYRDEAQGPDKEYIINFPDLKQWGATPPVPGTGLKYTVNNLRSGTGYIFKLKPVCGTDNAPVLDARTFTTTADDAKSTGGCGGAAYCNRDSTKIWSGAGLAVEDTFNMADYTIKIATISGNTAGGPFSGTGTMKMPIVGIGEHVTVEVSFLNVKVNGYGCAYAGDVNIQSVTFDLLTPDQKAALIALKDEVDKTLADAQKAIKDLQDNIDLAQEALEDAVDYFLGGDAVGNVVTGELDAAEVPGDLSDGGTYTGLTDINSNPVPVPAVVKDNTGEYYQIDKDGKSTKIGEYNAVYNFTTEPTVDETIDINKVVFNRNPTAKWAFDAFQEIFKGVRLYEKEYDTLGTDYRVPAKLILPGERDQVNATISGNLNPAEIVFTNGKGVVYKHTPDGNNFTLQLGGGPAADGQHIYAITSTDKKVVGKLLLASYAPQARKVVLVAVGAVKLDETERLAYEAALNAAYAPLGITYTVTVDKTFKDNDSWDVNGDGKVQPDRSKLLSTDYTGEEAGAIQAYVDFIGGEDKLVADAAYMMVVNEVSQLEDNLLGKMPAEERFGFIYAGTPSNELYRTLAHEIGHGAYHLEHTFEPFYLGKDSKAGTQNLMDYSTGTELWKHQWDIVHDPGHVWGVLKRDKDAAFYASAGKSAIDDITGIDCYGKVIAGYSFKDQNYYVRPVLDKNQPYIIVGFVVFDKASNKAKNIIRCSEFETDKFLKLDTAITPINAKIYLPSPDNCTYASQTIPNWEFDKSGNKNLNDQINDKVSNLSWNNISLYVNHDASCVKNFIDEIKIRDQKSSCLDQNKIDADLIELKSIITNASISKKNIAAIVNSVCKSTIGALDFDTELIPIFKKLVLPNKETINEEIEVAILRLMDAIKTNDYPNFFDILQDENNQLSKHLINEMNDLSVFWWWDKENYTNYIGALIYMIRKCPSSYYEQLGNLYPDLSSKIFNLTPTAFSLDASFAGSTYWASGIPFTSKYYYEGIYDSESGKTTIRRRIKREKNSTTTNFVSTDLIDKKFTEITDIDPLTPLVISAQNELPLVRTALGLPNDKLQVVIVPAIFFKYRNDKIIIDNLETTASVSLDLVSLFYSGGAVTFAKNISRAQRIYAMYELADAAGSLALTTQIIDPNSGLGRVVGSYNTAMGLIGAGTAFKDITDFYQKLNPSTKTKISLDQSLTDDMRNSYTDYNQKLEDLKASTDWNDPNKISADVKIKLDAQNDFFRRVVNSENYLAFFKTKNLSEKILDIVNAWKAAYPQIFFERRFFEDLMGEYRYLKTAGWGHTSEIASNFKAIDFYDGFTTAGDKIYSSRAISMKTTTTKNVDTWLISEPVKNNLDYLMAGKGVNGIEWNGKTIFYNNAEVHIYMPKENITDALKTEWLNKLNTSRPGIKFEINALEDFVK